MDFSILSLFNFLPFLIIVVFVILLYTKVKLENALFIIEIITLFFSLYPLYFEAIMIPNNVFNHFNLINNGNLLIIFFIIPLFIILVSIFSFTKNRKISYVLPICYLIITFIMAYVNI